MIKKDKWNMNDQSKFLFELPFKQVEQMSQEDIEQTIQTEQLYFQHLPKITNCLEVYGSKKRWIG